MSKSVKQIETQKLMVYTEVLTKMVSDLDVFGMNITQKKFDGIITEKEMTAIHTKLAKQIHICEPKRIECAKEITRRIKEDLGINRGPGDIEIMIQNFQTEYPNLNKTKEDLELEKLNEKTPKVPAAIDDTGVIEMDTKKK